MTDTHAICVRVEAAYVDATPTLRLREAVAATLRHSGVQGEAGVTVLVTDDETVRGLNRRFLGMDAPTDVLSFPAGDAVPGSEEETYLGDILIAYPYTARQAAEDGHNVEDVLVLLAVHGTLHLLGFDHDTQESQAMMWAAQEAILKQLRVPVAVMPSLPVPGREDEP